MILLFIEGCFLLNGFISFEKENIFLGLHDNTYIYPIIDNLDTPNKTFIRTLKVKYLDKNTKVKINDSTYYRCAYETRLTLYSVYDSLELNSISRKSCDIVAFFNLDDKQKNWMLNNHVYFLKIKNMNTKYEVLLENSQPRFFVNTFLKYDKLKE